MLIKRHAPDWITWEKEKIETAASANLISAFFTVLLKQKPRYVQHRNVSKKIYRRVHHGPQRKKLSVDLREGQTVLLRSVADFFYGKMRPDRWLKIDWPK